MSRSPEKGQCRALSPWGVGGFGLLHLAHLLPCGQAHRTAAAQSWASEVPLNVRPHEVLLYVWPQDAWAPPGPLGTGAWGVERLQLQV